MRNLLIIIAGNIAMESTVPLLITVSGLAGFYLAPWSWLATLPAAIQMLCGSLLAVPFARLLNRSGHRAGFVMAGTAMCLGGVLAALALLLGHFVLLIAAHLLFGLALVGINFFRYAAAESVSPARGGTASSILLASGTVAVVAGGFLYSFAMGFDLAIPFIGVYLTIAAFGAVASITFMALRSRAFRPDQDSAADRRSGFRVILENDGLLAGVSAMVIGQVIMLMVMTPASLAAVGCGLGEVVGSHMVSAHLVAMFAPGLFTGFLMARFGTSRIIATGAFLNIGAFVAGLSLASAPFFYISVPLILSGLGWNFMFLGGTQVISAMSDQALRSRVQGAAETVLAGASAIFTLASGVLYSLAGWSGVLAIASALLVLFGTGFLLRSKRTSGILIGKEKS